MPWVALAVGGAVGTLARAALGRWIDGAAGGGFPWGTLAVNVLGSFVLGAVVRLAEAGTLTPEARTVLAAGFCGAFTTFSTYSLETVALLSGGAYGRAAVYAAGSLALGLLAVAAGMAAVDALPLAR